MFWQNFLIATYILLYQFPDPLQANNYTVDAANEYIERNKGKIDQKYRLKYHFMPPLGWMNDPNGFIYYKDEYHLFYQFNPYDSLPQKIHWGHAKSKDLVHWDHLPVALAPDQNYDNDGVFSGSAIEKDGKLYVMYTGNSIERGQVQCIAVSDDGIVFKKLTQNPVLTPFDLPSNAQPQDFRDPKIFQRGTMYYVVLASKTQENTGQVLLYQSTDLINWTFKSILLKGDRQIGIMWECPDLFELDGRDVLLLSPIEMPRSGNEYHNYDSVIEFVGKVNWTTGTMSVYAMKELDHGMDFYATQSLLDSNGRRIVIAWMSMWGRNYPTHVLGLGWAGAMTLPRQLRIQNGYLVQQPVPVSIFEFEVKYDHVALNNETQILDGISGELGILDFIVILEKDSFFTVTLRQDGLEKTAVSYDANEEVLQLDRRLSGHLISGVEKPPVFSRRVFVPMEENALKLKIYLDKSSVEIFANDGAETMTANIYPKKDSSLNITFAVHGTCVIKNMIFSRPIPMNSIAARPKCITALFFTSVVVFITSFVNK